MGKTRGQSQESGAGALPGHRGGLTAGPSDGGVRDGTPGTPELRPRLC